MIFNFFYSIFFNYFFFHSNYLFVKTNKIIFPIEFFDKNKFNYKFQQKFCNNLFCKGLIYIDYQEINYFINDYLSYDERSICSLISDKNYRFDDKKIDKIVTNNTLNNTLRFYCFEPNFYYIYMNVGEENLLLYTCYFQNLTCKIIFF